MMRSLFTGVFGLRTHQTKMDVIGNNISNVNTVGFKSSRVVFADAFYQRLSGATGDNPETGKAGRNPMAIGLGVNVGSIDNLMTQGAAQRTDNALDLAIQGSGFFIVGDNDGTYFTRAGNVQYNGRAFSVNGMRLMGWPASENPSTGEVTIGVGSVVPLETTPDQLNMMARATTRVSWEGNLNPQDMPETLSTIRPMEVTDSIGNLYTIYMQLTYQPPITDENGNTTGSGNNGSVWDFCLCNKDGTVLDDQGGIYAYPNKDPENPIAITYGLNASQDGDLGTVAGGETNLGDLYGYISFDPYGRIQGISNTVNEWNEGYNTFALNFLTTPGPLNPGGIIGGVVDSPGGNPNNRPQVGDDGGLIGVAPEGNNGSIILDLAALVQQGGRTDFSLLAENGNPPGTLQDISVGNDGIITGRYSNGLDRTLGQIPQAFFRNPAGLERIGNSLWVTSNNSGPFDGVGSQGEVIPGSLEMSNVDIASEFTEMITTQRGFQANSRVLTTSDEMLQELVNLKR